MNSRKFLLLIIIGGLTGQLAAQEGLPLTPAVQRAIEKKTRTHNGTPGPAYWQNTANYQIRVKFAPATRELSGVVDIVYVNNSPDTLRKAIFKLYPNLYKKGVVKEKWLSPTDQTDGVKISKLQVNGQDSGKPVIDGTNMTVNIPALLPGKSMKFSVNYAYNLNEGSHMRTGQVDEGSYFIAYFFPRIAVYDDIDGWNMYPYRGSEEFYNDFCDFDVEISVPEKQVVWATGDLQNGAELFTAEVNNGIASAERSDNIVNVITTGDLAKGGVLLPGAHTWKFKAENVVDFAFAASDHYVWRSTSLIVDSATNRRTRVDAVFNPEHDDYYEVIDFGRKTVEVMSYSFPKWPFPYSHITVFDGLDQMEYPMMVNDKSTKPREDVITLTDHEIFHTMFPFYMGINETKYGWMDEGWATIGEWLISKEIDSAYTDTYGVEPYARSAGSVSDLPIMSLTTDQKGAGTFTNTYPKPAMGYLYVKDLLGDELFTKALHNYIRLWNGKHPVPTDFFNSMNAGSGKDLNWFWERWFYDSGKPNLGIGDVNVKSGLFTVTILEKGGKPLPVDLTVTYNDETTETIHRNISVWEKGDKSVTISFKAVKPVKKIVLGSTYVPDTDKEDNKWEAR